MKLGGFALKKGKRKALGASAGFSASAPAAPASPEKVFVTDFDPNAPAELLADGQKPLVIPLLETNAWQEDPKDQKKDQKSPNKTLPLGPTDEVAAAVLAETSAGRDQKDAPQTLVIPIASEKDQKRAELFADGEKRPKSDHKKPILQQNAVPGLDGLQDVTDKYRHDVALRPEAPDVHSDVYESVPVEAFGAALLRGMGWKGDVDPDDLGAAPQPRHKLLGLGATKRPKLPGEDKKKRKKRKDKETETKDRRSGLNTDKPIEERRDDTERRSRRSSRSPDRDRRRRSRSHNRSERRKRSRSRSRDRDRGRDRDRDRDRRSRSRDRSDRQSRRR